MENSIDNKGIYEVKFEQLVESMKEMWFHLYLKVEEWVRWIILSGNTCRAVK